MIFKSYSSKVGKSIFGALIVFMAATFDASSSYIFYSFWAAGLLALIICLLDRNIVFCSNNKSLFYMLALNLSWLIPLGILPAFKLLLAPDIHNLEVSVSPLDLLLHHLKFFLIAAFYSVVAFLAGLFFWQLNYSQRVTAFRILFFTWLFFAIVGAIFYSIGLQTNLNNNFAAFFKNRSLFSGFFLFTLAAYLFSGRPFETKKITIVTILSTLIAIFLITLSGSLTTQILFYFLLVCILFADFSRRNKVLLICASLIGVLPNMAITLSRALKFYITAFNPDLHEFLADHAPVNIFPDLVDGDIVIYHNSSAAIRLFLIYSGLELLPQSLGAGVGLDNFRFYAIPPMFLTGTFAHNQYLDIILSGGVFTFIFYYFGVTLATYYLCFDKNFRNNFHDKNFFILFIFLLLHLLISHLTLSLYTAFGYFLIFNLINSILILNRVGK